MTTKHTPHPWQMIPFHGVIRIEAWHQRKDQPTDGIYNVCELPHPQTESEWRGYDCGDEIKANARLIAAAPELLAMVRDLVRYADMEDHGDMDDLSFEMRLDEARELLAKLPS